MQVMDAMGVVVGFYAPIMWHPFRHILSNEINQGLKTCSFPTYLEKPQCFDVVCLIKSEAVVDARWDDKKIAGRHGDANPRIGGCLCFDRIDQDQVRRPQPRVGSQLLRTSNIEEPTS